MHSVTSSRHVAGPVCNAVVCSVKHSSMLCIFAGIRWCRSKVTPDGALGHEGGTLRLAGALPPPLPCVCAVTAPTQPKPSQQQAFTAPFTSSCCTYGLGHAQQVAAAIQMVFCDTGGYCSPATWPAVHASAPVQGPHISRHPVCITSLSAARKAASPCLNLRAWSWTRGSYAHRHGCAPWAHRPPQS